MLVESQRRLAVSECAGRRSRAKVMNLFPTQVGAPEPALLGSRFRRPRSWPGASLRVPQPQYPCPTLERTHTQRMGFRCARQAALPANSNNFRAKDRKSLKGRGACEASGMPQIETAASSLHEWRATRSMDRFKRKRKNARTNPILHNGMAHVGLPATGRQASKPSHRDTRETGISHQDVDHERQGTSHNPRIFTDSRCQWIKLFIWR